MFRKLVKRMNEHSSLMGRMMERLGVDTGKLAISGSGTDLANAARRCMSCGAEAECRQYLDDGAAKGAPGFCPNSGLFKANLKPAQKA